MPSVAITISGIQDTNEKILELFHENEFDTIVIPENVSQTERIRTMKECDAVLAGTEPYDEDVLNQLPNLKIIARQGVDLDNIDLEACRRHKVKVVRSKGAVEVPVTELIFAMILQFSRRLRTMDNSMHNHQWEPILAEGLQGKRIGLIGFGGVGREVAKRAATFNMNIYYYCRYRDERDTKYRATYATLPHLLQKSDYVVINVPLEQDTCHMIGAEELKLMKPNAVLINTSRGAVIDEVALADALNQHFIRGAGIDVYPEEYAANSPLMDCPNAILTPHVGTYTYRGILDMSKKAAWNIINFFNEENG